ncbi:WhiB family transcriptional regulator [Streptomyces globisporus]|uniref:WhiB family transcriptional regulator n=1 Tax=Streptomyces globisporus TaxID=1908 RepID=UPI0036DA45BE
MSLDWMDSAVCAGVDPELWFPTSDPGHKAKAICADCPVLAECKAFTDAAEEGIPVDLRFGVYAGRSARQRSRPARRDARDAAVVRLVERGMTPQEIAAQLDISDRTVNRVKLRAA